VTNTSLSPSVQKSHPIQERLARPTSEAVLGHSIVSCKADWKQRLVSAGYETPTLISLEIDGCRLPDSCDVVSTLIAETRILEIRRFGTLWHRNSQSPRFVFLPLPFPHYGPLHLHCQP
jgi:hypothetical protein